MQDCSGPKMQAIRRAHESYIKKMRRVVKRHPEHGKRLISEFKKINNQLLETSVDQRCSSP